MKTQTICHSEVVTITEDDRDFLEILLATGGVV